MQINEFSFSTLIALLRSKAKRVVLNGILAAVVGFLLGWCIPKEYQSEASIIPETPEEGGLGGAASLASMAGIDLGMGTDAISPELYPNVVSSNAFLVDMLYTRVSMQEQDVKDVTLLDYLQNHTSMPFWGYGKKALGAVMKKITRPKSAKGGVTVDGRINPENMSLDDEALVEALKYSIVCQTDLKTGIIYVSYRSQDPLVSKMVVDTLMQRLQQFITDYRTSKARVDLLHYQLMEGETRAEYERAQKAYAQYCDSHAGNLLQVYVSERDALENDMQLAMTAYQRMKQQVQLAESKVQEKTPAFTILDRASVPTRHCSPHKMLMAIMWFFLAGIGTVTWYYVRLLFGKE